MPLGVRSDLNPCTRAVATPPGTVQAPGSCVHIAVNCSKPGLDESLSVLPDEGVGEHVEAFAFELAGCVFLLNDALNHIVTVKNPKRDCQR
jgi:hypothetical protein